MSWTKQASGIVIRISLYNFIDKPLEYYRQIEGKYIHRCRVIYHSAIFFSSQKLVAILIKVFKSIIGTLISYINSIV
jgi:hypothetical protein